jgi:uncharacterized protein (TIGR01777 family)
MKILVSGSHGLVGKSLVSSLTNDGHEVLKLVRRERKMGSPEIEWDPKRGVIDREHLEGLDVVVHLAGESIAEGRWNDERKRLIRDSRVQGTQLLSDTLGQLSRPPKTFLSASAIGYYGNRGDETLVETSAPGQDFLSIVCLHWEGATRPAADKGIRVANLRFGIILSTAGGALEKMLTPFRMGVGGRIGSGAQWMSWIALDDVVGAIKFVLTDTSLSGPINFVAPGPVTNAEFTKQLGAALSRPTLFPVPAFGARLAFGEMADALLLSSQRVKPERLQIAGYGFQYPDLQNALRHVLSRR